jgi:microcystin-dependent protein
MRKREITLRIELPALKRRHLMALVSATLAIGVVAWAAPLNLTVFNPGDELSSASMNDNFNQLKGAITDLQGTVATLQTTVATLQSAASGAPSGTIIAFGGPAPNIPSGWLLCDGSAVSRTTNSALFAAIGTSWGSGDGASTFNLPDLRGRFLRGVDSGQGRDPDAASRTACAGGGNTGDAVGSIEADQFKSHVHGYGPFTSEGVAGGGGSAAIMATTEQTTAAAGGNETRPINAGTIFLIKD